MKAVLKSIICVDAYALWRRKLNGVINELLENERSEPYSFYINDQEVAGTLQEALDEQGLTTEDVIKIIYQPQATFRVVAVTRCSGTLPGHTEAILCVAFSPDCQRLLTGSGDATLRIWDLNTETPIHNLKGHKNWVRPLPSPFLPSISRAARPVGVR